MDVTLGQWIFDAPNLGVGKAKLEKCSGIPTFEERGVWHPAESMVGGTIWRKQRCSKYRLEKFVLDTAGLVSPRITE